MSMSENKVELCDARNITENMVHQVACAWDAYSAYCEDNDARDKMVALYILNIIEGDIKIMDTIIKKIIQEIR